MNTIASKITKAKCICLVASLLTILTISLIVIFSNSNAYAENNDLYTMKGKVVATTQENNAQTDVKNALIIFDSNEGTKTAITDDNAEFTFDYVGLKQPGPQISGRIFIVSEYYTVYTEENYTYKNGEGTKIFDLGNNLGNVCKINSANNDMSFDVEVYRQEQETDFHVLLDKVTFSSQFCVENNTEIKLNSYGSLYFNIGPEITGITIEIRPPKNADLGFKCWLDQNKNVIDLNTTININNNYNFYALFAFCISASLDYGCSDYSCAYYYNDVIDHTDSFYGEENAKINISGATTIKRNNDNTITVSYSDIEFSRSVKIIVSVNSKPYYEFEKWTFDNKTLEKGQQIEITVPDKMYKLIGSHKAMESCHTVTFDKEINHGYIIDAPGILVDNCVVPDGAKLEKSSERDTGLLNIWNSDQSEIIYQFFAVPKNDDPGKVYAFDKWVITDNVVTITSDINVSAIFKTISADEVKIYGYIETQITPQTTVPIKNAIVVFVDDSKKITLSSTTDRTGFFNFYAPSNINGSLYVITKDFNILSKNLNIEIDDIEMSIPLSSTGYKCTLNTNLENTYATGKLYYQGDDKKEILIDSIPVEDALNIPTQDPYNNIYIKNNEIVVNLNENFIFRITPENSFEYAFKHILDSNKTIISGDKTITLTGNYELTLIYAWKLKLNFNEGIDCYDFTKSINGEVKEQKNIKDGDEFVEGLFNDTQVYRTVDTQKQIDTVEFSYKDPYTNEEISYKFSSRGLEKYNFVDWKLNDESIKINTKITIQEINKPYVLCSVYEGVVFIDGYVKADSGFTKIEVNATNLYFPYANKEVTFNNQLDGKTYKTNTSNDGYYKIDLPSYSFGTLCIKDDNYGPDEGITIDIPELLPATSKTNNIDLEINNPKTCNIIDKINSNSITADIYDPQEVLLYENINFNKTFKITKSGINLKLNENNYLEYKTPTNNLIKIKYDKTGIAKSEICWVYDYEIINNSTSLPINNPANIYLGWKFNLNYGEGVRYYKFTKSINGTVKEDKIVKQEDNFTEFIFNGMTLYRDCYIEEDNDVIKVSYIEPLNSDDVTMSFTSFGLEGYSLTDWKLNDEIIQKNISTTLDNIHSRSILDSIYQGLSYIDGYVKADSGFSQNMNNSSLMIPYLNKEITFNNNLDSKVYKTQTSNDGYYKINLPNKSYGTLTVKDDNYGPDEGTTIEIPEVTPATPQTNNFELSLSNPISCKTINETTNNVLDVEIFDSNGNLLFTISNFNNEFLIPKSGSDLYIDNNNFLEFNLANGNLVIIKYRNIENDGIFWSINETKLNIDSTYYIDKNTDIYLKELINPQNILTATTWDSLSILIAISILSAAIGLNFCLYYCNRKRRCDD